VGKKATDASLFKWQCKNNYKQKASLKIYTNCSEGWTGKYLKISVRKPGT